MLNLSGKTAVITGGETGIGLAISKSLAQAGAQLVIGGLLEAEGQAAVNAVAAAGGKASFRRTDVRSSEGIEALIDEAMRAGGKLDILVNNAGVFDGFASVLETSQTLWDQVIDINLRGCFFGCQAALKHMVPQKFGRIVNTASVGGIIGSADGLAYTASKFGVIGITKQAACTYAKDNITVNAVCPGVITTDIRKNSATILGPDGPDMQRGVGSNPDAYKLAVPAQRKGTPKEVGDLVVFLASDEAAYITGQAIAVDGGWTAG